MSGKGKKFVTNGFSVFLREYRDKHYKNVPLRDVTEKCGEIWKNMDENQRQVYTEKARALKGRAKKEKFTNTNIPVSVVQAEEEKLKEYECEMEENIIRLVCNAGPDLCEINFYIVHVNTFCYVISQKRYLPAEIAVCRFSLLEGVKQVYHKLCRPGPIPMGYSAEVKAQGTHELSAPDRESYQEVPPNLEEIFEDILNFISQDMKKSSKQLPYLFVTPKNFDVAFDVFKYFCEAFEFPQRRLKVYSLVHLFYNLRNFGIKNHGNVFPALSVPKAEIERDVYSYTLNISCQFHEDVGKEIYCSKSIVTRMAYLICDHCCANFGISLIPGRHVPRNAKLSEEKKSDASKIEKEMSYNQWSESNCSFEMENLELVDWDKRGQPGYFGSLEVEDRELEFTYDTSTPNTQEDRPFKKNLFRGKSQDSDITIPCKLSQDSMRSDISSGTSLFNFALSPRRDHRK